VAQAKRGGCKVIKDVWEESDTFGKVKSTLNISLVFETPLNPSF